MLTPEMLEMYLNQAAAPVSRPPAVRSADLNPSGPEREAAPATSWNELLDELEDEIVGIPRSSAGENEPPVQP